MLTETQHLPRLARLIERLETIGLSPILVGGLALVLLGSRRVTLDVDFLVSIPPDTLDTVLTIFYDEDFQLASRLDANGHIIRTIDNSRVAATRIRLDKPDSLFFLQTTTGLRVDLLLDFPLSAALVLKNAKRHTIQSSSFLVASPADLLTLKEHAYRDRKLSTDLQDIEFLKKLRPPKKQKRRPK